MNSFSSRKTFSTASSIQINKTATNMKNKSNVLISQKNGSLPIKLPLIKSVDMVNVQLTSPSLGLNDENVVKKLSYWEREHIKTQKASSDSLYQSLKQFYIKEKNKKDQNELEKLNYLLKTRSNMNFLLKASSKINSTAIQTFVENKQKEEGAILINTITKTKNRFNCSLYGSSSQSEIENELNIDTNTLKVVQQEGIQAEYYGKIIKEKAQMEEVMKQELMDASLAVYNKKKEKNEIIEELDAEYNKFNQLNKQYKEQYNEFQRQIDLCQDEYSKESKQVQNKTQKRDSVSKVLYKSNELESKLCILKVGHTRDIEEHKKKANKLNQRISHLEEQGEYLKYVQEELIKENQLYFKNILKKGYDVRHEGLVWIVKNLLEIQANLEYHDFPKFLSHEEINYLISLASIILEEQLSMIILNALKQKQKKIKYQSNFRRFSLLDEYIQKQNPTAYQDPKKKDLDKSLLILMNRFTLIERKHHDIIKDKAEGHLEDFRVKKIYEEIHNSLIDHNFRSTSRSFHNNNAFEVFFEDNKDTKEYLEMIFHYRERLSFFQTTKTKLKENAMNDFKERQLWNKNRYTNVKSSIEYELVFSALFGSNIQG